jgi:hypothetical protein
MTILTDRLTLENSFGNETWYHIAARLYGRLTEPRELQHLFLWSRRAASMFLMSVMAPLSALTASRR